MAGGGSSQFLISGNQTGLEAEAVIRESDNWWNNWDWGNSARPAAVKTGTLCRADGATRGVTVSTSAFPACHQC